MSETYISLYGEKAEAFRAAKAEMGPDGVEVSNVEAVMRLVEEHEDSQRPSGGLTQ